MDDLGLRLKALRQKRGLSQRRLAQISGVSNATVSLIEHGRTDPSMGLLRKILDALGMSFAGFFAADVSTREKYFYARDELSEIGSGPISYLQVGSDLSDGQLQILYERYKPGADTGQSMLSHDAGDKVPMTLIRGGKTHDVRVHLRKALPPDSNELAWQKLGIRLAPLSRAAARRYRLREDAGLVVIEVDRRSPAAQIGMKEGDLLNQLGPHASWPLGKIGLLLEDVRPGDAVDVVFYRFYRNYQPDRFRDRMYAR
ncbi:MAG: helix-turn-helix domain-containing protein [Proteobacteria bacterium]|nr:helix-turn-helix domain-containing protein [Pseudomonadota bacterium]